METKRFDIISEADASVLEPGSTVRLAARGHIPPLAADTLRERRITVIGEDLRATPPGMSLVPVADVRRIAIGSDHVGFDLKAHLIGVLRARGLQVQDVGTLEKTPVDYPDVAAAVSKVVARQEADAGIVIDGAGLGSAIAANKIRGIRAAMCSNETLARYSREHNGANVLTLGATLLSVDEAVAIVLRFLETAMREPRYIARLEKIARLEHS
jgi:ribose 5-phosphate isomerase B